MDNATQELRKALATHATGQTSGAALIPEVVSEGLRRFVELRSPLYAITPKRDWPTNAYIFRQQTALPAAGFLADGAALGSADASTYSKDTTTMKYIYSRGEVTGPMQKAAGSLFDAMQLEIEAHADAVVREIELNIISGDSGADADEFDGLLTQISLEHDAVSTALSLSHMDTALDTPAEYPSHAIMSRAMGRKLWSLLQAQQRFIDRVDIEGGFRVPSYNDVPVIRVDNDADTDLAGTIIFPDMRHVVMPINQQLTYEPLSKTKDSDDFMLKMYLTLACEGTSRFHVKLVNIVN
jgi:HK97 family phage major capsid protein